MLTESLLTVQGSCIRFQQPVGARKAPCGLRGKVGAFTEAARRRLVHLFATIDHEQLAEAGGAVLFLTLTTPPEYWQQPLSVYRALRRLRVRLSRRWPDAAGVWRREVGDGGMLHYHAVIFNVDFIPAGWLRHAWRDCLGSDVTPRVHLERVRGDRVCRYVAKYCAKAAYEGRSNARDPHQGGADEGVPHPGAGGRLSLSETHNCTQEGNGAENTGESGVSGTRWWYVWNREKLPFADEITISTATDAREVAQRLRRVLSGWLQRRAAGKYGLRRAVSARFAGWLKAQRGGWMVFLPPELEYRLVVWAVTG